MRYRLPDHKVKDVRAEAYGPTVEEGLSYPSAVRSGAGGIMVQRRGGGNGEKRMSAFDNFAALPSAFCARQNLPSGQPSRGGVIGVES